MNSKSWLKIKEYAVNLVLLLLLISIPLLFNFWFINSMDSETKERLFIQEKIEFDYPELSGSTPRVSIVEERKTLHLKKDITFKKGDLVYFYDEQGVAVLVDGQTADILGLVTQRNP